MILIDNDNDREVLELLNEYNFDLGGVLLKWEPMKTITEFFPDKVSREKVVKEFLKHKDWAELDRGTLSYEKQ